MSRAVPGGEYGKELNISIRSFDFRIRSATSTLGFPVTLNDEEFGQILSAVITKVRPAIQEFKGGLEGITPPGEFRSDHNRLVAFLASQRDLIDGAAMVLEEGDIRSARAVVLGQIMLLCETRDNFSSADFKTLVAIHFGVEPGPPCGPPPA